MSGAPLGREQGRGELETARALNTVATIGAGHALYTSLPEAARAKMGAAVVRRTPRKVVAAASRARRKVALPKNAGKKAVVATTGAWLGFHGAELAGDIMARRSINNQIRKLPEKETAVKAYETPVDFSKAANRGSGHGVNLVSKRYFDPEADRQRRIGLYAGLGGGSALVLGEAARRQFTGVVERHPVQGKQKRGRLKNVTVGLKEGKRLRTPILLGGAAALSAIGGAAAYKHGISERNRPYS